MKLLWAIFFLTKEIDTAGMTVFLREIKVILRKVFDCPKIGFATTAYAFMWRIPFG
jgi:hypothetical protein